MATKPKRQKGNVRGEETWLTRYNHKKMMVEMMEDRGYIIPDEERSLIESLDSYIDMIDDGYEEYGIEYEHITPLVPNAYLSLYKEKDSSALIDYPTHHHIIIIKNNKKVPFITQHEFPRHSLELIDYNFFAINPTKHFLAPKIRILKPVETKIMVSKTGWTLDKLPGISINDVIVRYYGLKVGTVIEFTRETHLSFFNKNEYYWRVVRPIPIIHDNIALVDENDDDPGFGDEEIEEEPDEEEENVPLPDIYE